MFLQRTLIFLLSAVLGSLADHELFKDRHRNYNANTNFNQILGGHNGASGRDVDRDRGSALVTSPKYDGMMKSGVGGSGKDRGTVYVSPKYVLRGTGAGGMASGAQPDDIGVGIVGVGGLTSGRLGSAGYDTIDGGIGYGDGFGGEICDNGYKRKPLADKIYRYDNDEDNPVWEEPTDDEGSREGLFIVNNNYNVLFKGSRRFFSPRRYVDGKGGWGSTSPLATSDNGNSMNNNARSGYRRANKWGPLRATYFVDREPNYANELPPTYVNELQPSYIVDRQLTYSADQPLIHSPERQPNYANELRAYPTTLEPEDEDYDSGYWGPSMNSNVNYNYLSGRRSNVNSNANNNEISYGGYGPIRGQEKYPTTTSYPSYDDNSYNSERLRKNRGSQMGYPSKRNRQPDYRVHPKYNEIEDEDEDNDVEDDYMPFGNTNINTNSNMNIVSRRNIPRKRRSLESLVKKSDRSGDVNNDGTTETRKSESTTTRGPVV